MKVDYIIVGLGLAGLAFTEKLLENHKTFIVFENQSQTSSLVAGGVYNPVVLRKFTAVWNAGIQLDTAIPFYTKLEQKLQIQVDEKFVIKRAFKSTEEQNNWFYASDKPQLKRFLHPSLDLKKEDGVVGDYGFGIVNETGRIDTLKLIEAYRAYLEKEQLIQYVSFDHEALKVGAEQLVYKDITCSNIVFCEGFGLKDNPFFNYLPLDEVKGELITIYAPDLNIDFLLKSALFLIPLGNNTYKVGATFNHKDKTSTPSKDGRLELVDKLKKVITVPYTILNQTAGIRPATKDRKPFVGRHSTHKNLAILNGMGTRGVMLAPTCAAQLYNYLEHNVALDSVIDITRFNV